MLPTKGYFQDIECPYYDSSCGRPYCHFRHRKKATENIEEIVSEPEKDAIHAIPTYKPTPKSELANIHNSKSHIPISYVPDLAFRPDRKSRPLPKFDKPTYKPTPLSILSSANKESSVFEENGEHSKAINEIKQNIANVEYNPTVSLQPTIDIDFEDLSTEFELIDELITSTTKVQKDISENVNKESVVLENNEVDDLTVSEDDNKKSKLVQKTPTKHHDVKVSDQKQEERKNRHKISDDKKEKFMSEKYTDKIGEKSDKDADKKEKSSERHFKISSEKTNDKYEKYSDKKEKFDKDSDKKEKHDEKSREKHLKSENSKRNTHEKNSEKSEKKERKSNKKDRIEKTKSSKKDRSSDRERSSSSKVKCIKANNEKRDNDKSHKSNSRDKHRKEDKRDRNKEEKHNSHKNKQTSKDRSRSRSKERRKSRDREKEKEKGKKHCDKNNSKYKDKHIDIDQHKEKNNRKSGKKLRKDERKIFTEESSNDSADMVPMSTDNFETNLSDLNLDDDDDDETMLECYKIFNEYRPPQKLAVNQESEKTLMEDNMLMQSTNDNTTVASKKRVAHANAESSMTYSQLHPPNKPKTVNAPGQALTNRYKIAKLAQANKEQEFIMNELKQPPVLNKRPAPTLLEAAREHKRRKEYIQSQPIKATCLVDDIIKGTFKSNILQSKITIKKIAPAQNVSLMEKAKERISKIKQTTQIKTIAQTQKSGRVAHVPEVSLSDIPDVLQAEKSKLPVNVRTRFLTMLADECVKLYVSKDEGFTRALNEEFSCYEKCKVLATYRNSAMLAVNRLRKEIQEREKLGLGFIGLGEDPTRDPASGCAGRNFYNKVKKWILTEEELDIHGYPRESEEHHGRAVIKNYKNTTPSNIDENQRICARCHKIFQVDDDGWPLFEEECLYHPLKKRTIRGEQTYLCCRSNDSTGCATSDTHVTDMNEAELEGFQTTMDPEYEDDPRSYAVYALDCEMCYTTKGLELTRVTIVDTECKTVYESLVKPLNPIIDYNTRFSGITKEQMEKTSTSILQIQANILHLCNSKTILVGHSLESDMKALKIVHGTIIDTSILFPHKMGLPHKRALKALASELLRKIIQNDISGHDSAEDAITCMELIKWKLKNELKVRGSK